MEEVKLRDPNQQPTQEILKKALNDAYPAFDNLMQKITEPNYGLEPIWNFYNDGKAWLCKAVKKKKTICWISVWDGYFKTAFYFTEKTGSGIDELNIDESIKHDFHQKKPIGKLLPLVVDVKSKKQVDDVLTVVNYKITLK